MRHYLRCSRWWIIHSRASPHIDRHFRQGIGCGIESSERSYRSGWGSKPWVYVNDDYNLNGLWEERRPSVLPLRNLTGISVHTRIEVYFSIEIASIHLTYLLFSERSLTLFLGRGRELIQAGWTGMFRCGENRPNTWKDVRIISGVCDHRTPSGRRWIISYFWFITFELRAGG